jgi:hypothetical protein
MAKDKSKAKQTIEDKMKEMNKFTLEDVKNVGEKIYENKPLFTGTVVGSIAFLLTSAGVFASIGAGALAGYGIKKLRGDK